VISLTPIDVASHTGGSPIPVGLQPTAIAITPDGRGAYVTNFGSNTVTPINVNANAAGPPIPVDPQPAAAAVTPDGSTAYITSVGVDTVTPVDVATNTARTPIPLGVDGDGPQGIAITRDGTTAYVANFFSGTVTPIDVATNTPGTPIKVGGEPFGIAIAPERTSTPDTAGRLAALEAAARDAGRFGRGLAALARLARIALEAGHPHAACVLLRGFIIQARELGRAGLLDPLRATQLAADATDICVALNRR
jgi:YVTN family beta-propeller protein